MNRSEVIDRDILQGVRAYSGEGIVAQAELKADLLALPAFEFARLLWNQYQTAAPIAKKTAEQYSPRWDDPEWVAAARDVAKHEAAHVAVALFEGGTVNGVMINNYGGGQAECTDMTPQAEILCDMAGMVTLDEPSGMYSARCSTDKQMLLRDMRKAGYAGDDNQLMISAAGFEPIVNDVLAKTWAFRREVADLLLEQGELGPNEVNLLWQQCQ